MPSVLISLVLVLLPGVAAQEDAEVPDAHIFGPLLGKRVMLEGIAWERGKGVSGRILLPSGVEVYITEPWQTAKDAQGKPIKDVVPSPFSDAPPMLLERQKPRLPQGKLVQVVGTLTFKKIPPSLGEPRALPRQGYPEGFSYFALQMESFKVIERAEHDFPTALSK